jgi:hypothetical protein
MRFLKISLGVLLGVFIGGLAAQTVLVILGRGQIYSPINDLFMLIVTVICGAYGGKFVQRRQKNENVESNSSIKILKVIGGFILGWLLVSGFTRQLILISSGAEISRTTDIIQSLAALCGGITGVVITYKRVNLKKYED